MSRIILVTNPADDSATKYLDSWLYKIVNLAKKQKDTFIFELRKKQANKKKLILLIKDKKPQFVIFNGHGSNDSITGFGQKILIKCGENEHLLKDKIIHSLSCNSARKLGPRCIKIGTLTYIGYEEEFKLVHLDKSSNKERLEDEVANFFLKPAYEAVIALIEGATAKNAYERSQKMYLENLEVLITSSSAEYNTVVASLLFHNLEHQVCLGNNKAYF